MSAAAKIGTFLFVWIVIPIALGVVGYYVVGPRLSDSTFAKSPLTTPAKPQPKSATTKPDPGSKLLEVTIPAEGTVRRFDEPDVEVSVTKIARKRRSSTRRKSKPKPAESQAGVPVQPSEKQDQGGSGGAGGAGDAGADG